MSIAKIFESLEAAIFSPIEHAAADIFEVAKEEEAVITDDIKSLFGGIAAGLTRLSNSKAADAKTISDQGAQIDDLKSQLADTQQALSDSKDELIALLAQVNAIEPDPTLQPAV